MKPAVTSQMVFRHLIVMGLPLYTASVSLSALASVLAGDMGEIIGFAYVVFGLLTLNQLIEKRGQNVIAQIQTWRASMRGIVLVLAWPVYAFSKEPPA